VRSLWRALRLGGENERTYEGKGRSNSEREHKMRVSKSNGAVRLLTKRQWWSGTYLTCLESRERKPRSP
jgi:hypothetical protein